MILLHNDFNEYSYLCHYGILGMKWGVRRYQNKDGSLTISGKFRYGKLGKDSVIKPGSKLYRTALNDDRATISETAPQYFSMSKESNNIYLLKGVLKGENIIQKEYTVSKPLKIASSKKAVDFIKKELSNKDPLAAARLTETQSTLKKYGEPFLRRLGETWLRQLTRNPEYAYTSLFNRGFMENTLLGEKLKNELIKNGYDGAEDIFDKYTLYTTDPIVLFTKSFSDEKIVNIEHEKLKSDVDTFLRNNDLYYKNVNDAIDDWLYAH